MPQSSLPPTSDQLYGDLFTAAQTTKICGDSKTFVDALPKRPPPEILASFTAQNQSPDFDLAAFIHANFDLPPNTAGPDSATPQPDAGPPELRAHIDQLWDKLTRSKDHAPPHSSLLALPHPYIVPGGRFREIYYWDSYFTMLGLAHSGRQALVAHMVANFAHLIDRIGFIPNGNRTYYCTRSQPPFFALMVELLAESQQDEQIYLQYLPQLEREYQFWMAGSNELKEGQAHRRVVNHQGTLLNRYWDDAATPRQESHSEDVELAAASHRDPAEIYREIRAAAESGWDFSIRWFADAQTMATIRTTQMLPVDLNALLHRLEDRLSHAHHLAENPTQADFYRTRATHRQKAIQTGFFDQKSGLFTDLLLDGHPAPTPTAATAFPLFLHLATPDQATQVATYLEANFLRPGGWASTLIESGQQWDAPNGWAPLQWAIYQGLKNYGHQDLANQGAHRWAKNCLTVFRQTGKLLEKYNIEQVGTLAAGGEYQVQDGFGWTNATLLRLLDDLAL